MATPQSQEIQIICKAEIQKSRNLINPFCALQHRSEFRPNEKSKHQRAAGECGKYLSLLSQMYFHVASTGQLLLVSERKGAKKQIIGGR